MIKLMGIDFCSIGGWCYSEWWLWDLKTIEKFQENEMSPGLFQDFMDGIKTLKLLVVEHGEVVITGDSQSKRSQIESHG